MVSLYDILYDCTTQVRIGDVITQETAGPISVTTIDAMPAEAELKPGLKIIDCVLLKVAVDAEKAEHHRAELIKLLEPMRAELEPGPSYIALGGTLGDQGAAFQLMALGEVLGLWKVITPKMLGKTNEAEARHWAGAGYVMISGYRRQGEDDVQQTEREAAAP
jgi:hypothetical protein